MVQVLRDLLLVKTPVEIEREMVEEAIGRLREVHGAFVMEVEKDEGEGAGLEGVERGEVDIDYDNATTADQQVRQ